MQYADNDGEGDDDDWGPPSGSGTSPRVGGDSPSDSITEEDLGWGGDEGSLEDFELDVSSLVVPQVTQGAVACVGTAWQRDCVGLKGQRRARCELVGGWLGEWPGVGRLHTGVDRGSQQEQVLARAWTRVCNRSRAWTRGCNRSRAWTRSCNRSRAWTRSCNRSRAWTRSCNRSKGGCMPSDIVIAMGARGASNPA
eukprot:351483-Chlamydomonas_euryale.AAC.8